MPHKPGGSSYSTSLRKMNKRRIAAGDESKALDAGRATSAGRKVGKKMWFCESKRDPWIEELPYVPGGLSYCTYWRKMKKKKRFEPVGHCWPLCNAFFG
ncbi:hypothetical protein RUM44_000845 [Polyplax serrata]|uniref:Uncharacterized protein n=1 Tax=Polyplax serrata TaxID=468196 RepID=A0ABR1B789_POLSC